MSIGGPHEVLPPHDPKLALYALVGRWSRPLSDE